MNTLKVMLAGVKSTFGENRVMPDGIKREGMVIVFIKSLYDCIISL
jgi:hypothetical protein